MRAFLLTMGALVAAGLLAPTLAPAQQVTPAQLLKFAPTQKEIPVEYDTPSGDDLAACKAEMKSAPSGKGFAYTLRDAQGRMLRRFADTTGQKGPDGKSRLDTYSYYKDGFEVYREVDLDKDSYIDECHWLNTAGVRIATIKNNKVAGWKRISAEETSKVLVQALSSQNASLLATILVTPEELTSLGLAAADAGEISKAKADLAPAIQAIAKGLVGWDAQTVWQRFDGSMPHCIPAEGAVKNDVVLYENAFVFVGQATGDSNPAKIAYVQIPEMVKLGETWKLVVLPKAVNPAEPVASATDRGIRAALVASTGAPGGPEKTNSPELDAALKALADHDKKSPGPDTPKQDIATFHYQRVKLLDAVMKVATTDDDRLNYTHQIIDSLAAAYQTGVYQAAGGVLDKYAAQGGGIGPYAAYRKILAEYALDADQPGADFIKAQKTFLEKLEGFLTKFDKSDQVPEVLFQLASINEFNAEEEKAHSFYDRLAKDYAGTEAGKKATGAIKRLGLIGKPLDLSGPSLDGKTLSTTQYKGKTLLVAFWTSTADPVRKDLPELIKVYQKYKPKGFEIIGVNLDADKAVLDAFLKESPLPWPQIFEPGGMDSRLADDLGIITLPTLILVDGEGKVISRNVRNAADLDRYLEKIMTASTAATGTDIGAK